MSDALYEWKGMSQWFKEADAAGRDRASFDEDGWELVGGSLRRPLKKKVFVFGSNLAGVHGAGSARFAHQHRGAVWGVGEGLQGDSYAIPTKDMNIETLPRSVVRMYVARFLWFARQHPELQFEVVKIGCGLAGFTEDEIAPMFETAPENCQLPDGWRKKP